MRLVPTALIVAVAGLWLLGSSSGQARTSADPQLRCKYGSKVVTKRVHGHKKRVKVCKKKPKPPPPKPKADLALTLTSSLDRVTAGNQFTYEIEVANQGPTVANGVEVSVTFPAGALTEPSLFGSSEGPIDCEGSSEANENEDGPFVWRCRIDSLPPVDAGDEADVPSFLQLRFLVEPENAGAFAVEANVEADSTTRDPNPSNNHATSSIDVLAGPASADLALSLDASAGPATVTDDFTVTVRVTNHGPTEATSVEVTVLLPLGTQSSGLERILAGEGCQSNDGASTAILCWPVIEPGETVERTITLAPVGSPPPTLDFDAIASAHTADPHLADNRAHLNTVVAPFTPPPGVDLVAHLGPPETFEGYFIVPFGVANRGTDTPEGAHALITVTGPVTELALALLAPILPPPGRIGPCDRSVAMTLDCPLRGLASGSRVDGIVYAEIAAAGTVKTTLTVSSDGPDASPADNTITVTRDVTPTSSATPTGHRNSMRPLGHSPNAHPG
jgi:uncharacterized repeat protein (TIGR01451 family)